MYLSRSRPPRRHSEHLSSSAVSTTIRLTTACTILTSPHVTSEDGRDGRVGPPCTKGEGTRLLKQG
eukprot:scaffold87678_cov74-Phaeocystis_antarctica.AAC.3